MPTEPNTDPVFIDDEHCVRTLGDVIVTLTKAPPSATYLRAWAAEADRVVRQFGSLAVYTVISGVAPAPSEEAKAEIRRVMTRHASQVCGVAYVVEGTGFSAAAMRSALTLISLVARYPYPQKTFAKIGDASHWISALNRDAGATSALPTAHQLDALVETMRAEHARLSAKTA